MGRVFLIVLVLVGLVGRPFGCAQGRPATAAGVPPPQAAGGAAAPYDLMVLVIVGQKGTAVVAFSYAASVGHAQLRSAVAQLASRTRSKVSGLMIEDQPLQPGSQTLCTAGEFSAEGLVPPRGGPLPLVPIFDSLPGWRHLRVVFRVPEGLAFAGPDTVETPGLAARLIKGRDVYEYDVVRMNGRVAPSAQSVRAGRPVPRQAAARGGWQLVLLLVAPVVALIAAWLRWGRKMPKKP
jgi:hypothetical protein